MTTDCGTKPGSVQLEQVDALRSALGDVSGDFIAQLVGVYRVQAQQGLDDLERAAKAGDREGLRFAAHALKGSTLTLGGTSLGALCAQLERLPAASAEVPSLVFQARSELGVLLAVLARYLSDRGIRVS